MSVIFYYWHASAHATKLHRQGELPRLKRLYEGKEEIARLEGISATRDIVFSKRFIGWTICRLFQIKQVGDDPLESAKT